MVGIFATIEFYGVSLFGTKQFRMIFGLKIDHNFCCEMNEIKNK